MMGKKSGNPILAVDLGSTCFKAALFDRTGRRLGDAAVEVSYLRRDSHRCELDPEAVRSAMHTLVSGLLQRVGVEKSAVELLALDSQAQTFCVVDGRGRPVSPFISWIDGRAEEESIELSRLFGADFHRHCSFARPSGKLLLSKLLWLHRHVSGFPAKDSRIVSLPSFAAFPGFERVVTDGNLAAMSGAYSLARSGWWREALDVCGLDPAAMGDIVDPGERLERGDGPDVVMAGNDQTAGAYGNGCRAGEVVLTLGTALVAYRFVGDTPGPFSESGAWGPYPGGGFYELATCNEGGLALDWARKEIAPRSSPAQFDVLAEHAAKRVKSGSPLFFPERIHSPRAWSGEGDVGRLAYSVLEGIAFLLRRLVSESLSCGENSIFRVIGGGSRSDTWMAIIADVLNAPVRRGNADSLLGAAMIGAGLPCPCADERIFEPRKERRDMLETRYAVWRETAP